jgi:hypothetical protein
MPKEEVPMIFDYKMIFGYKWLLFMVVLVSLGGDRVFAQDPTDYEYLNHGIFLEPLVTYQNAETTVNYPAPYSRSNGSDNGLGLGIKAGAHIFKSGFLALDVRYGMTTFKDSRVDYDAHSTSVNWGPMAGVQLPYMAGPRFWVTYIVDGEMNPRSSHSLDVKFKHPEGLRVGIGFRVSMVSLNLEYEELKFQRSVLEKAGPFDPNVDFSSSGLQNRAWIASVSFPLYF